MDGPAHYRAAEKLLEHAKRQPPGHPRNDTLRAAGLHATLARVALDAMKAPDSMPEEEFIAWGRACGVDAQNWPPGPTAPTGTDADPLGRGGTE